MLERQDQNNIMRQGIEGERDVEQERACVFCEIAEGRAPASKIAETKNTLAFAALEDGYPLLITREHFRDIFDPNLDLETQQELGIAMTSLSRVVKEMDAVTSVTIVSNNGPDAGQEIPHLHIHIMPRFLGDGRIKLNRGTRLSRVELDIKAQNYKIRMQQPRLEPH